MVGLLSVRGSGSVGGSALSDESTGLERRANSLASSGRYAAAVHVQRRLVEAREQSLGGGHPGTLAARHNLARWTGEAGDAAGARDQLTALRAVSKRVLGPEHPDTLAAQEKLAYWTDKANGDVSRGMK